MFYQLHLLADQIQQTGVSNQPWSIELGCLRENLKQSNQLYIVHLYEESFWHLQKSPLKQLFIKNKREKNLTLCVAYDFSCILLI